MRLACRCHQRSLSSPTSRDPNRRRARPSHRSEIWKPASPRHRSFATHWTSQNGLAGRSSRPRRPVRIRRSPGSTPRRIRVVWCAPTLSGCTSSRISSSCCGSYPDRVARRSRRRSLAANRFKNFSINFRFSQVNFHSFDEFYGF